MTIQIECGGCGRPLGVGDEHAGKRARCPVCGFITLVAGQPAPLDVLASPMPSARPASSAPWRMRTPEGQVYGPVTRPELDRWVSQGRVSWDCQLQQEQDEAWRPAGELYPALRPVGRRPPASEVADGTVGPSAARDLPEVLPEPTWPSAPTGSSVPVRGEVTGASPQAGPSWANPYGAQPYGPPAGYVVHHRGGLILALAIASWILFCFGFLISPLAWALASADLRDMNAGRMNPDGRTLTSLGMAIAIANTVCWLMLLTLAGIAMLVRL